MYIYILYIYIYIHIYIYIYICIYTYIRVNPINVLANTCKGARRSGGRSPMLYTLYRCDVRGGFFVWSLVVVFLFVCCVVLFLLCVCVDDLFLFSHTISLYSSLSICLDL